MNRMWLAQVGAVIRLEMKKTFFAKRGLWVYLLALAPVAIFLLHSLIAMRQFSQRESVAAGHPLSTEALLSIREGMTSDEVEQILGEPFRRSEFVIPGRPGRPTGRKGRGGPEFTEGVPPREFRSSSYTDGRREFTFVFLDGAVQNINRSDNDTVATDSVAFATVFQFFYLRLAVFFGCVGVFMNLFRGEMLDKSLHFYLLAPLRREVLAVAKYLAGLIATVTIFTTSAALQLWALFLHLRGPDLDAYLSGPGWGHIATYLGVTVLACVGYGSVFLAAGMLFRNPIIPAVGVLVWEGANIFLPAVLKKFSVIFYLRSLCPIVAPPDADLPAPVRLLINSAEPTPAPLAILGLLVVTAVVLLVAGRQARRLEINYGAD